MPSRFLPSLVAAAALLAWPALAAEPVAGLVVSQLGPTSPSFKMGVNRSETGAPEATAIGARPIEKRPIAASSAEWRSSASHPSSEKDAEEKAADKKAADDRRIAGARPGKAGAAKVDADAPSAMDVLREKLAAKLGAKPAADGKYAMQVSNRGESGENRSEERRVGKEC